MNDLYGADRQVETAGLVTSEFAQLMIGGVVNLLQGLNGSYGRQVNAMFEAGTNKIYLTNGQAQGQLTANCAIGKKGFLSGISGALDKCGRVDTMSVNLLSGNKCSIGATGGFVFEGAVINNIQFGFTTGQEAVTEGFGMIVPHMAKKK